MQSSHTRGPHTCLPRKVCHQSTHRKWGWALSSKQRAFPLKNLEKQNINGESHTQETNTIQMWSNSASDHITTPSPGKNPPAAPYGLQEEAWHLRLPASAPTGWPLLFSPRAFEHRVSCVGPPRPLLSLICSCSLRPINVPFPWHHNDCFTNNSCETTNH